MNDLHSPTFPTMMMKMGSLTRIQSVMITREDRSNRFVQYQEKSSYIDQDADNHDDHDDSTTSDIMIIKPALRQSIHSFQSSDCYCSGEVEPPKYPRRERYNSIDMNDIEGMSEQSITDTKESSSSSSRSLLAKSIISCSIDDQIIESIDYRHHPNAAIFFSFLICIFFYD